MPFPTTERFPSARISRTSRRATALAALAAGAALAACAPEDKFPPACPAVSFLKDGADLTRFSSTGRDLTDMVLDVKLTGAGGGCSRGDNNTVKTTLQVRMDLTRGPAATDRRVAVTYFVAATEGDRVLDEQDYTLRTSFPANTDRVTLSTDPVTLALPVSKDKSAAAYHVYVGLRLTPEELALNRRRGER